ncbi:eEF1A lysine and N-terminal methyltransferase homolog [Neodiprion fabricii]|uniref:eEF1A lysine and N-terminal methyltransferase homolog n=1 Tax=Neodiprion fabricii TaxID=2872261 RepID=UPI001ED8F6DE|nr:eEF1A lysine and N-terminal methyltransferase homolog [Neodiprion fabricii]
MDLLPKSHEEFSQQTYWNTFFSKRGKKAFEWYGEYPELCGHLHKYIKPKDDVLVVGCGNSTLSMDLYDVGYRHITNIDISHVVIRQMIDQNKTQRPAMIFEQMDATAMSYPNDKFSVVLDKGTLDALMPDESEDIISQVDKLFGEISRVLRVGGRYVCVSLLQEHILRKLLSYFPQADFMFRVTRCYEAEAKTREEDGSAMPVFVVIATKFKKLPALVLEVGLVEGSLERVSTTDDIISAIKSAQQMAVICSGLHKGNVVDVGEVSLDLYRPGEKHSRYTMYVLDQPYARENEIYAAFIVPQGRETMWLFCTKEGRQQLLKTTKRNRLVIVTLRREHTYESLDAVKRELSITVRNLAPAGVSNDAQIPYLSLASNVGKREVCYEGDSKFSGQYVIEEIEDDNGSVFRRLIFLNNQFVIQSEAKLKIVKSRRGKPKKVVDPGYLACEHHIYMSVGVSMIAKNADQNDIAIIGLGGGGLCTFLRQCLPEINIIAVDIDEAMLQIATNYFGLVQDAKLKVEIADGLKFILDSANQGRKFSAILFDVDSKDTTVGMSCPPKQFIETSILQAVAKCIGETGLFILNLVCRDPELKRSVLSALKSSFKSIYSYNLESDVNEVVFCTVSESDDKAAWKEHIKNAATNLNRQAQTRKLQNEDIVDVADLLERLTME